MEKILYVSDLDGTLLTSQDRISQYSYQGMQRYQCIIP